MTEQVNVSGHKRFSVVIPLYNKSSHIESTLNSVLSQSFHDFEVVVIDDGSTDDSLQNAQAVEDPRVKIITQVNRGVSAARNRGIKEATGDYIAFLDADDHWYPWHLEELNSLIRDYPDHGVYSVAHEVLRGGEIFLPAQPFSADFKGEVEDFFGAFSKSLALVNSTTACLSRDFLLNVGGFPEGIKKGEDVYVWLKAALEKGLAYDARVCARYNQDAECRSYTNGSEEIPYYLMWLDDLLSEGVLGSENLKGAKKFLQTGIFFNAAGFKLIGNKSAFKNMKKLRASRSFKLKVLLFALQIMPRNILKIMQRYRHAKI